MGLEYFENEMCLHLYVYIHICIWYLHIFIYAHMHLHIFIYACTNLYTLMCVVRIYVSLHRCHYTFSSSRFSATRNTLGCLHVCACVCANSWAQTLVFATISSCNQRIEWDGTGARHDQSIGKVLGARLSASATGDDAIIGNSECRCNVKKKNGKIFQMWRKCELSS